MQKPEKFLHIISRECHRITAQPIYIFCMVVAPLLCTLFFTSLMQEGLPKNLPVGIVDQDNTATTRNIIRNLDAFSQTGIAQQYPNINAARKAMQQGKIYAFYYIPEGTTEQLLSSRQPKVSFYTNNSFLIAGSLIYRDMRTMSELAKGSVGLTTMQAKGINEALARAFLQPIVIDTHALQNPWLNYSVYLNNTLLPGVLMLLIFMMTAFAIGSEIKEGTSKEWLKLADNNMLKALIGKLLPHTLIFYAVALAINGYIYGVLAFPFHSSIGALLLLVFLMVLASQAVGVFFISALPTLRLGLSACSLWGVISFSISGFSFPVMAMHPTLQMLSNLFPLRHYFLIYVSQTLNGYPIYYAWKSYLGLMLFLVLPLLLLRRLKTALLEYDYIP